jgi:hypothetical protein
MREIKKDAQRHRRTSEGSPQDVFSGELTQLKSIFSVRVQVKVPRVVEAMSDLTITTTCAQDKCAQLCVRDMTGLPSQERGA